MRKLLVTSVVALALLTACKTQFIDPDSHGNVHGSIALVDTMKRWIADRSGISVRTLGREYSTLTDSLGNWTLRLPSGTYDFEYSKQGFGTVRSYGFSFAGNGDGYPEGRGNGGYSLNPAILGEKPHSELAIDSIRQDFGHDRNSIIAYFHPVQTASGRSILLVSRDSSFDPTLSATLTTGSNDFGGTPTDFQFIGGYELPLYYYGFQKGERLFAAVAAINPMTDAHPSLYFDPRINRMVHTSFGPIAKVIQFVVE